MDKIKIKTIFLIFVLLLTVCIPGMAKTIRSADGRVTFTTSDNWQITSLGPDVVFTEMLTVALDKDTGISLYRGKNKFGYRSFNDCSYSFKSSYRDSAISSLCESLKTSGYDVKVTKADIFDNVISVVVHTFKNGQRGYVFHIYTVKDFVCYRIMLVANDYTAKDASMVLQSLTVDGIPYSKWLE